MSPCEGKRATLWRKAVDVGFLVKLFGTRAIYFKAVHPSKEEEEEVDWAVVNNDRSKIPQSIGMQVNAPVINAQHCSQEVRSL